ncbi:MAG: hypothetical protein LBV20_01945, partial [Treponema sp.]|nr:hypothetical protein [Treponema sp.]
MSEKIILTDAVADTDWLFATVDCWFPPGRGVSWNETTSFSKEAVLSSQNNVFNAEEFIITITEKTSDYVKGFVTFEYAQLSLDGGDFFLNKEHPVFGSNRLNVSY